MMDTTKFIEYKGHRYFHGQEIQCMKASIIIEGILAIEGVQLYICHNNPSADGSRPRPENRFGQKYGWTFTLSPSGQFSDRIESLEGILTSTTEHLSPIITNLKPKVHEVQRINPTIQRGTSLRGSCIQGRTSRFTITSRPLRHQAILG